METVKLYMRGGEAGRIRQRHIIREAAACSTDVDRSAFAVRKRLTTPPREAGTEPNWREQRREQLRSWASLPLREQLTAVEELGELARRIQAAPVVGVDASRKTGDHIMDDRTLLILWAKLPRNDSQHGYHPVLCHLVDVALVAWNMWTRVLSPATRRRIAQEMGVGEEAAGRWVAFWAGLHDLGKASPAFQFRVESEHVRLVEGGFPRPPWFAARMATEAPHGTISTCCLPGILTDHFALSGELASRVATVVGGHHGVFPRSAEVQDLPAAAVGSGPWESARAALACRLADLLGVAGEERPWQLDNAAAMFLAGLISVADWIGSVDAEDFFPYAARETTSAPELDLESYLIDRSARAEAALKRLRWTGWTPPISAAAFTDLFPDIRKPNDVQNAVVALARNLDSAGLVIIEAPMGEGKTEAAMYLEDHWSAAGGQSGCYFALPTQATSNQMFGRVRDFLAHRHPGGIVNLQLLHGHAALSEELELLRKNDRHLLTPAGSTGRESNVVAAEWFTHRKRGLLAPFGVGTVDQALLAVLQTRHVFVRLFGLGYKTVIVDEVHAYDTYMTALLERLLEWLGALRSSVVLLSATLPNVRRQALAAAYARGRGVAIDQARFTADYPRITWVAPQTSGALTVPTSPRSTKTLTLNWVDGAIPRSGSGPIALGERLQEALEEGGCAAVICNTVRRAQEVYAALKEYFPATADDDLPELDLLHARFPFEERDKREKRSEKRFGKPKSSRRPRRAVLVATQIIEQSLDLDFDLMVTEFAPVDLVLQRTGRLHRHDRERPARLVDPELWILRTEETDGVPGFDPGTEKVYDYHVLLRSWLALRERTIVQIPENVEEVIEAVYDERPCPANLDNALQAAWERSREQHRKDMEHDQQEALQRWLKRPSFTGELWRVTSNDLAEDGPELHSAHQALTRLTEPTAPLVCLYGPADFPSFDARKRKRVNLGSAPSLQVAKRLLACSVPVSDRRVVFDLLGQPPPAAWRHSALLRHHRLLLLDGNSCGTVGRYRLSLDPELGLVISARDSEKG